MTGLRRYSPLRPSKGTEIPASLRTFVLSRDGYRCVLKALDPAHVCVGGLELDHVRASGALGKKSRTTADNLVTLCAGAHRHKTLHGREMRPVLLAYLERAGNSCSHVDPVFGCPACARRADPLTLGDVAS